MWDWFVELNERTSRIKEGVCYLIPLSEYLSWAKITGNIVYSWEYDILMDMDAAYSRETNAEFEARREKEREANQNR